MFNKNERATFKYTFAHWCAFQMTALNNNCWKFKYLFHDVEKPFLKLIWNYKKVQKYHRFHNNHHIENYFIQISKNKKCNFDWEATSYRLGMLSLYKNCMSFKGKRNVRI